MLLWTHNYSCQLSSSRFPILWRQRTCLTINMDIKNYICLSVHPFIHYCLDSKGVFIVIFLFNRHVFLGFTRNGQFVLSYTVSLEADVASPLPTHVYRLQCWHFMPYHQLNLVCFFALLTSTHLWTVFWRLWLYLQWCLVNHTNSNQQLNFA